MSGKRVLVLGATGLVGRAMVEILEQRQFPIAELIPAASARSAGKTVRFRGQDIVVKEVTEELFENVDIALFSAGGGPSRVWAPIAAKHGAVVIDNSSAWRMDPDVPLVVPEVNPEAIDARPKGIIANPNCSTIQLVVALAPLHRESPMTRLFVSTYQAISGAGLSAVEAFEAQDSAAPNRDELNRNLLMSWTVDEATDYSEEELKVVHETRKIMSVPGLPVSVTAVRVPVVTAHSEAVVVETEAPISPSRARKLLASAPGIVLMDDFARGRYPRPLDAAGQDPVYVGRVRRDLGSDGLALWVVADNLRKGAALNAVQIAERL